MSTAPAPDASATKPRRESLAPVFLILGGVVVLVALFLFLGRSDRLERTAIGFDGLGLWLRQNGVETVPILSRPADGTAPATLRILPLYDTDLADDRSETVPAGEKPLGAKTQRTITAARFEAKIGEAPTLVVLPKWRGGFPAGGKAHPDLLIPTDAIFLYGSAVARAPETGFGAYELTSSLGGPPLGTATVYSLQVLGLDLDEDCETLVSIPDVGTILAQCYDFTRSGDPFFVLSDPDLLDNHGLALGDNAAAALKLVALAGGGPVFIDNTTGGDPAAATGGEGSGAASEAVDPHERSLSDLSRFFAYPFSYVWAGFVLLTGLALWRGSRRFGRAIEDREDGDGSKRRTIEASGRILRLAGTERELVDAHVRARMDALATALLPRRKAAAATLAAEGPDAVRIERILARRSAPLAARFAAALRGVTDPGQGERARFEALGLFERILQEIWHEFGRAADASRQDRR